jgi:eukaryotic-like serine/threonine-protein kinase
MSHPAPAVDPLFLAFQLALAGRYSIDRELGRGGRGVVYLAREVHLDRLVAIKLLPPERAADPTLRERFLREARLAAKLSHPNIIPIHAVEDTGGFVFYVMSFVDGETLAERVRTRGPLPSSEGARVLREAAWALAYAHAQGLVHRDVKPDNILLESATGRVLVADFGIAAAAGDAAAADGVSGTPEFMSPEQVLGKQVDARSDLYGLGATAFYAFSGRFPFEGATATEVMAKQVTEPAPPLASLGMPVPRKLAALVDRCLAKDPAHRPPSAQALAEQLSVALEQRRELPVALRAFVKRQGRLDGGGTLIVGVALLTGSVITSSLFGGIAGFTTFVAGMTAVPFAYLAASARRLTMLGFGHQDLEPAFKGELEQAREELLVQHGPDWQPSVLERGLPLVAAVSGVIFAFWTLALAIDAWWLDESPIVVIGLSGLITLFSSIGTLVSRQRHRDVDTEFWSKVWMGRIGKGAFAVAKKLLGARAPAAAMTHRATELSLGMAAEQLYESLPKESRQALGDLPSLLRRLQDDAQLLRRHYDELQEALGAGAEAASSPEYEDLLAARDAIHAKLGQAVGALETIRLNLLRLHAGAATVASVTTHLGLAAEVTAEVERLIAAHQEVEGVLKFPRPAAATPV